MLASERTLAVLDWPDLLVELSRYCRTAAGRQRIADLCFLASPAEVDHAYNIIDELDGLVEAEAPKLPLGDIVDLSDPLTECGRGQTLSLEDLRAVRQSVDGLARLADFGRRFHDKAPNLARLIAGIDLAPEFVKEMRLALDDEGQLSAKRYPTLADRLSRISSLRRQIETTMRCLLADDAFGDSLQDDFYTERSSRFVVPLKAHAKGLGLGIVHDASRSGQTVYVEPHEIIPAGNQLRVAEAELKAETTRILRSLSQSIAHAAQSITAALDTAVAVDLLSARHAFAQRLNASRPVVGSTGTVALKHARHPLLVLQGDTVVANDLGVGVDQNVLILSGPNTGGKTVALKTIGLYALLVRAGCFVPAARGSRVDFFDSMAAEVGDRQTVREGLSSFSGHIAVLKEMLADAQPNTLLLLDELAAGTDPAQGGPFARAVLETLADSGATIVATTHYAQVKALGEADERVASAALEYVDGEPTYRVIAGSLGESHALSTASTLGIADDLIERARELMDASERALADALADLEAQQNALAEESAAVEELRDKLEMREAAVRQKELRIRLRSDEMQREGATAYLVKLKQAEDQIRKVVRELQANPAPDAARRALDEVKALKAVATVPTEPAENAADNKTEAELQIGERVRLSGTQTMGDIVSIVNERISLRVSGVTMQVKRGDIERTGIAQRGDEERRGTGGHNPSVKKSHAPSPQNFIRTDQNTLDLRGERVVDGLARLHAFLDRAVLSNWDAVFVLHGHGTGAMKQAIREELRSSAYADAFAAATPEQGGDAFTVVVLG